MRPVAKSVRNRIYTKNCSSFLFVLKILKFNEVYPLMHACLCFI